MALTDSLISYWKMDEVSGDAVDAHGSNTLTNSNAFSDTPGKLGGRYQYFDNASNSYFYAADNASLSVGNIDFSVALWFYLTSKGSSGDTRRLIGQYDYGNSQRSWFLDYNAASDRLRFVVSPDGTSSFILTAGNFGSPSISTWYYVIAWHDAVADTINIQVNNGTVDSVSHSTGVFDSTANFSLGTLWNNGVEEGDTLTMDGGIDEVAFWKKVLSGGERTSLYNSDAGLAYPLVTGSTPVPVFTNQYRQRWG